MHPICCPAPSKAWLWADPAALMDALQSCMEHPGGNQTVADAKPGLIPCGVGGLRSLSFGRNQLKPLGSPCAEGERAPPTAPGLSGVS